MRRWYGSLENRIMEGCKCPKPEVGMGVTEFCWSDRHPYEVTEVIDDRHIKVRRLDAKRIDDNGMSECQVYDYTSNPNNAEILLFFTKQGQWREKFGRRLGCDVFGIGFAEEYHDYSF